MALKHGAITAPTGVTVTGVLIHEKRTRIEDVNFEAMDNQGAFSDGKSIRTKTSHSLSGECLSTVALPTVGEGTGSASVPHIDSSEMTEKNEGAADFSIEDHYYSAGLGDFST